MKILLAALLSCVFWAHAGESSAPPKAPLTLAQGERLAVQLKQGMTLPQVQKLLGNPTRTALRAGGTDSGMLRWTYAWSKPSERERNLEVVFARKSTEDWLVNGWEWSSF